MDKDLLMKLFSIGNSSGNEEGVSVFIKNYFDSMGIFYEEDEYGNIFSLKNTELPILNAHMDSVQDSTDEALTKFIKIRGNVMSGYGVIGGDDKCGLFAILEVLKQREVNFIITREEEIGCVGMNFFMNSLNNDLKDFPWGLTLDRYGSGDIICEKNSYGTKDFEDALYEVGKTFGYKPAVGLYSDADYMSEGVSCANISVGYYGHHTKNEYVVLSELQNSIKFVIESIDKIKTNFEAPKKLTRTGEDPYYSMYDYREDDLYNAYASASKKNQECFITKKKSKHVTFIPSLNEFISPEGARRLYEDLEQSGILYEELKDYEEIDEYYEDDIDELLRGIV